MDRMEVPYVVAVPPPAAAQALYLRASGQGVSGGSGQFKCALLCLGEKKEEGCAWGRRGGSREGVMAACTTVDTAARTASVPRVAESGCTRAGACVCVCVKEKLHRQRKFSRIYITIKVKETREGLNLN
eukprot:1148145-Pelagomonas_calceolata.AAC.3